MNPIILFKPISCNTLKARQSSLVAIEISGKNEACGSAFSVD